jgi:type II secretory pathway component PulC
MRAVRLLCLALLVAIPVVPTGARAEAGGTSTAKSAKSKGKASLPPYRLVRILPETNQALLLDKKRGKHVLVDVGDAIGAYQVVEIESDQVVLGRDNDTREYVLVAGEVTPTARLSDPYPIPDPAADPGAAAATLLDPYPAGVLDPYGSEGVREVQAPDDQRAKPGPDAPDAKGTGTTAAEPPATTKTPPADTVKQPQPHPPAQTSFTVVRKEMSKALSDFAQIGKDLQLTAGADGVSIQTVAAGSFFHKMGLRDGDLVKKVDGTAIHGMDDAATVYARLGKLKKLTVEIVRAGAPLTLRYQITK